MSISDSWIESDDLDPIDVVETLAAHRDWDFDRIAHDQIAMSVQGQWRTYSLTLAWCSQDETLRLICTFEMEPPKDSLPGVYELLNSINDTCWTGAFSYWWDQKLMVYRYGLVLAGEQIAGTEQVDRMIDSAIMASERFYPAFQLVAWGDQTPGEAMQIAIAEAYGRA